MEEAQKCPRRQWIKNVVTAQKRKREFIAFEKKYAACSKQLAAPPRRSVVVGGQWTRKQDLNSQRSVVAEMSERRCPYYRGMSRSRKSRAKRHGRHSTSSRSPQQGNGKMMTQHTKEWSANQAPVAPSTPSQTCGATDQYSDISSVSDRRGAGSSDSSSNGSRCKGGRSDCSVTSRTTSSERKRSAPAGTQTSDELARSRLLRIAQTAFTENSSSLEPRSSVDDTPRQGDNRAGGWSSVDHYYNWYTSQWNALTRFGLAGLGRSSGSPARTRHSGNSTRRHSSRRTRSPRWSRPRCCLRRPINARRGDARAVSTLLTRTSTHMQRLPIWQMLSDA